MLLILKAADTSSDSVVLQNNVVNTEKTEETVKERPSKKKKKEKEKDKETIERPSIKSYVEKRLLVLPMEASLIAIFLLVLLVAFYVVSAFLFFVKHIFPLIVLVISMLIIELIIHFFLDTQ